MGDGYHKFLIAMLVFTTLLLNEIYHLIELPLTRETSGFEFASTITLVLQANRLTKCASHQRKSVFHKLSVYHLFQQCRETKKNLRRLSHPTSPNHPQTYFQAIFALSGSAEQGCFLLKLLRSSQSNQRGLIHLSLTAGLSSTNRNPTITQTCNYRTHKGSQFAKIFPFTIQCSNDYTCFFYKHFTPFFTILMIRYYFNYLHLYIFFITTINIIICASAVRIFTGSSST